MRLLTERQHARGVADSRPRSEPRVFHTSGWESIDPSTPVEEETVPSYRPEKFYPALGYGASATVWLFRDLLNNRNITLKIYTATTIMPPEIKIYNHLATIQSEHAGRSCLRPLLEVFQAQSPLTQRQHTCLLTSLLPGGMMSAAMVRTTIRNVLAALDFLHTKAKVIHTDLQPNNILLRIKDDSILSDFEQAEFKLPVPRKTYDNRTICLSRPLPISYGTPVLCDLGEARLGTDKQRGDIMPDLYRAPEVILSMQWDSKVDIWNAGMVIWDLFEHPHLFRARSDKRDLDDGVHLAEMQAVLRPPPPEFLGRSERCLLFWDKNGYWKGVLPLPGNGLEAREERLQGEEKKDFLRFLRRMLCWLPEDRATAKELLFDPWLIQGVFN
ncbi:hypothetical protein BDW74DRAFT_188292 [Aspergillus multicolor]|uniref:uncharacterized protein n=1 Tax=Aspergillus multicolor TaxID=41759 RepID=UPI003CCDFFF7